MTCEIVIGHRGAGKSLYAVARAREYLERGRPVASNLTLFLDQLMPPNSRATFTKLPGVVRASDLVALGDAYTGDYDEMKFGLCILDEAGSWLNSRDWQDKGRRDLFRWATQSRKFGWDLLLIIQDYESLDAQLRRSLVDTVVSCMCLDRIRVPFIGRIIPKLHLATGRYKSLQGPLTHRKWYRSGPLKRAYNTREQIAEDINITDAGEIIDARGSWSGLSAWHLKGRFRTPAKPFFDYVVFVSFLLLVGVVGSLLAMGAGRSPAPMVQKCVEDSRQFFKRRARYVVPGAAVMP